MATHLADTSNVGTFSTDEEKIEAWRLRELEAAGYTSIHAQELAKRHSGPDSIDLHKAIELVTPREKGGKGADPHVAFDILR